MDNYWLKQKEEKQYEAWWKPTVDYLDDLFRNSFEVLQQSQGAILKSQIRDLRNSAFQLIDFSNGKAEWRDYMKENVISFIAAWLATQCANAEGIDETNMNRAQHKRMLEHRIHFTKELEALE
ncbi:MAG: hypothetical protein IT195_14165 [Microthrixaceae bacterium]|nr:hypothetical protein [Microthrixaceae bacterium]